MSFSLSYELPLSPERVLDLFYEDNTLNAKYDHWGYENIKIVQKNKSAEEIEVKLTMRLKSKLILPMFREWVEKITSLEVTETWSTLEGEVKQGDSVKVCSGMGLTVRTKMKVRPGSKNNAEYEETLDFSIDRPMFRLLANPLVKRELKTRKKKEKPMMLQAVEAFQAA